MKSSTAIAERIKKLMLDKGINESELIEKSKLSPTTVNNILQGKLKNVLTSSVFKIAKALNVPLQEFFHDDLLSLGNLDDTRRKRTKWNI